MLYTEEFPAVLYTRDQYILQSFYTIIVLPDDGPVRSKICRSFYNNTVHLLHLCAFVGLNYSN